MPDYSLCVRVFVFGKVRKRVSAVIVGVISFFIPFSVFFICFAADYSLVFCEILSPIVGENIFAAIKPVQSVKKYCSREAVISEVMIV